MSNTSVTIDNQAAAGLSNTQARFGAVAKTFHWTTALLILTMIPLGIIAKNWPYDTSEALAFKATLFSIHKTLGLAIFAVALLRIAWALIQPRPAPVKEEPAWQEFLANIVHFALYGALVVVPLSGWLHHAATSGFAPIWWPFGQTLFFIPQSEPLAQAFAVIHFLANLFLVLLILLHVAGALKHHVIDRDATLRRMLPGMPELPAVLAPAPRWRGPARSAAGIWALLVIGGAALGLSAPQEAVTAEALAAPPPSGWVVQSGTLGITVLQLGQPVSGEFADWTAAIEFSETADAAGIHGDVAVTISVPTLTLGGVTSQALGADFLDAENHAVATFVGPIIATETGFAVDGAFTLVGQTLAVTLPFDLTLDGETANASGQVTIDRRDFGIGESQPDEANVGFSVEIAFDLVAIPAAE